MAIAGSGIATRQLVAKNMSKESYAYTDRGAKRSISDATNINKDCVQVIAFLLSYATNDRAQNKDAGFIKSFAENGFQDFYEKIILSKSSSKFFSSVPVRLGAMLAVKNGESIESVSSAYIVMANAQISEMTLCQQHALKQFLGNQITSSGSKLQNATRAMKLFSNCNGKDTLRISEADINQCRETMTALYLDYFPK